MVAPPRIPVRASPRPETTNFTDTSIKDSSRTLLVQSPQGLTAQTTIAIGGSVLPSGNIRGSTQEVATDRSRQRVRPPPTARTDKPLPIIPEMLSTLSVQPSGMVHHKGEIDSTSFVSTCKSQQGLGSFQNASNFSVNQPVMIDHIEHLEVHQSSDANGNSLVTLSIVKADFSPKVFATMRDEYVLAGAEYNSSERDDPPRCHPDTRTRFLEELEAHIYSGSRFIWLHGPAGAGKSAIMQTLAEIISPSLACSTLFFSRLDKRQDCKKIFTTLAYNFAIVNAEYRRFLKDRLTSEPGFLAKSLQEQFKRLFILPFLDNHAATNARPWVVIIDGFDESSSETDQCRVLGLIRESILHHSTTTPFVWVISSRAEAHLNGPFSSIEAEIPSFWKTEVSIGTEEASRSAEIYFRTEFAQIRQNYADALPRLWPSEVDLVNLAVASWGLYIFSKTLSGYIAEEDPPDRLERIKYLIKHSGDTSANVSKGKRDNPFRLLDILYTMIMSDIPPNSSPVIPSDDPKRANPNTAYLLDVCNILQLKHHTVYIALRKLCSVLLIPPPEKAHEDGVQFRHVSFADFLVDESRSKEYHISLSNELLKIWQGYCKIAKQSLYQPGRITLTWEPENPAISVFELERRLAQRARSKWLELLTEFFHDSTLCRCNLQYRFSPKISEAVDVLRDLSPFIAGIPRNLGMISKIYYWLCRQHAPTRLQAHVVVRQFALGQLSENDLESMFQGILMRGWACYAPNNQIDLTGLRASEWDRLRQAARFGKEDLLGKHDDNSRVTWRVLGELLRAKEARAAQQGGITVTVMELRPSEFFVIIGPCAAYPPFEERRIPYLVFPFIEPIQTVGAQVSQESSSSSARML
ncbi:hypothetical protein D9756_002628 [Leucocoprinus leucothites]|uniref:NACHT domain-containing protein n=1 Tax=Leucocoprinus leucothites TaxID=201217 RepID=A0A8H5GBK1_9AGAR|nr:hypothetical protein D9756_002628 [Leucoagaricus leucothites]